MTILDLHSHSLYSAATESIVSETCANNTWAKMATHAVETPQKEDFFKDLAEVEASIKSEYGITTMPNPWRSAKSIIKMSYTKGIKLYKDDDHTPRGKSEVQQELRDKQIPKSPSTLSFDAMMVIANHWTDITDIERAQLIRIITSFSPGVV